MFEKMLSLVKNEVAGVVGGMSAIPQDKQGAVVDAAAGSLMNGLKQYANPAILGSLLGIGGAKGGAQMAGGLTSGVVTDLISKAGLTPGVAKNVAGGVVPAVMSLFKKQVGDPSQPGFDLQSIAGALTGGPGGSGSGTSSSFGGLGGILGGLGNLFGKK